MNDTSDTPDDQPEDAFDEHPVARTFTRLSSMFCHAVLVCVVIAVAPIFVCLVYLSFEPEVWRDDFSIVDMVPVPPRTLMLGRWTVLAIATVIALLYVAIIAIMIRLIRKRVKSGDPITEITFLAFGLIIAPLLAILAFLWWFSFQS